MTVKGNQQSGTTTPPAPPSHFVCPLTRVMMTQPVMTIHGQVFEKRALAQWLNHQGNDSCPVTRQPLFLHDVISHRALEQQIIGWKKLHGVATSKRSRNQQPMLMASSEKVSRKVEDKIMQDKMMLRVLSTLQKREVAKSKKTKKTIFPSSAYLRFTFPLHVA